VKSFDINSVKAKFHYASWFGTSSEPAGVMEFGFYETVFTRHFNGRGTAVVPASVCAYVYLSFKLNDR